MFRNAAGDVIRRPALQGFAALYNRAFEHSDMLNVFTWGCFDEGLYDEDIPRSVLLDHDPRKVVATRGLELANTVTGLAFRLPLAEVERAEDIAECIGSARKACVSVGCVIQASEMKTIAGQQVRLITKVQLEEISLVGEGACPSTFAEIVDLDAVDDLWTEARKPSFVTAMAASTFASRARRVADALGRLRDHAG